MGPKYNKGFAEVSEDKRPSLFPLTSAQRSQRPPTGRTAVGVFDDAGFYVAEVLKSPVHSQPVLSMLEQVLGVGESTTGLVVKRGVLSKEPRIFSVPVLEKKVLTEITDTYSLLLRGDENSGMPCYVEIHHITGDVSPQESQFGAALRISYDPLLVALFSNSWRQLQDFAPYQTYLN